MKTIDISDSQEIYTVSRLTREARFILEGSFPPLWVEGEISNFMAARSGHWYFSLKDELSQVRCAMFRPQNRRLTFTPKDGSHVFLKVRVTLYEGRGDFQLLVECLEEAGVGKLQKEFEALKKRLAEQGLFDTAHKKNLPTIPQCVGVITSPQGAAIQDILHILKRRYPALPVIIYPTLVQGDAAAADIVSAIKTANHRKECDVLILARGGGSIEDLWPFNHEKVAHAIFECEIPIVSGVGHEIDFTISDFVADLRAPTPSAAAELITPDKNELLQTLSQLKNRLTQTVLQTIKHLIQNMIWYNKHLQQLHPKKRLAEKIQQLDFYELKLVRLQYKMINQYQQQWHHLCKKVYEKNPRHFILDFKHQLLAYQKHLIHSMNKKIEDRRQLLGTAVTQLNVLSPLATLERGYAIAISEKNQLILRSAEQVKPGDKLKLKLHEGNILCTVDLSKTADP